IGELTELAYGAQERFDLERAAGFDVLEHGSLVRADGLGAGKPSFDGQPNGYAESSSNLLAFPHHLERKGPRFREPAQVAQVSVGERADGIERKSPDAFEPDFSADIAQDG